MPRPCFWATLRTSLRELPLITLCLGPLGHFQSCVAPHCRAYDRLLLSSAFRHADHCCALCRYGFYTRTMQSLPLQVRAALHQSPAAQLSLECAAQPHCLASAQARCCRLNTCSPVPIDFVICLTCIACANLNRVLVLTATVLPDRLVPLSHVCCTHFTLQNIPHASIFRLFPMREKLQELLLS